MIRNHDFKEYILLISLYIHLRYAIQTLTPANIIAEINGHSSVSKQDVIDIDDLFFDSKRSASHLSEQQSKFLV